MLCLPLPRRCAGCLKHNAMLTTTQTMRRVRSEYTSRRRSVNLIVDQSILYDIYHAQQLGVSNTQTSSARVSNTQTSARDRRQYRLGVSNTQTSARDIGSIGAGSVHVLLAHDAYVLITVLSSYYPWLSCASCAVRHDLYHTMHHCM